MSGELIQIRPGYSIVVDDKALSLARRKRVVRTQLDPIERAALLGQVEEKRKYPKYLLEEAVTLAGEIGMKWAANKLGIPRHAIALYRAEKKKRGEPVPEARKRGRGSAKLKPELYPPTRFPPKRNYLNGPPGWPKGRPRRKPSGVLRTPRHPGSAQP